MLLALLFACDTPPVLIAERSIVTEEGGGKWHRSTPATDMPEGTKCWYRAAGNATTEVCDFPVRTIITCVEDSNG